MTDQPRGLAKGDIAVSGGVILLGLIAAWQTTLIPQSAYAAVGPRAFAWGTSVMLVIMGFFLLKDAMTGGWSHETDDYGIVDWKGGLWMVAGLIANVALIEHVGFILISTVLFICTAKAFGSVSLTRDAIIGFLLVFFAYVGFDRVLGYKIGSGLIERLL
ncbi:MAG: tripartite tricarboxylate transporter TctB family protein [Beijerinckiaceae bacterium]